MDAADDMLFVARVVAPRRLAEAYDGLTEDTGQGPDACWFEADIDRATLDWYCTTPDLAHERLGVFESVARANALPGPWQTEVRPTPREDWAESWKRFFHPAKVSPRVWIAPSWEPATPGPGEFTVQIDPGMSFGTGQHATTRACIACLDRLAGGRTPPSLIDAGCGSGILAITAARLGYGPITAFDNDPQAVSIARENAALNGVAERIDFRVAELGPRIGAQQAEVVVANILAPVLMDNQETLASTLSPGESSRLILSGLLREQADEVLQAFAASGLALDARLDIDDWTTLCLRRS